MQIENLTKEELSRELQEAFRKIETLEASLLESGNTI